MQTKVGVVLLLVALFYTVSCDYRNGELTMGMYPELVTKAVNYEIYRPVYGITYTSVQIDQPRNLVHFQGTHQQCPNGNSCSKSEYVWWSSSLRDDLKITKLVTKQFPAPPLPSSQGDVRYTPLVNDKYAYFVGGVSNNPFNIYTLTADTRDVVDTYISNVPHIYTAAAVNEENGYVTVFAATYRDIVRVSNTISGFNTSAPPQPLNGYEPIMLISDKKNKVYLIAYDSTKNTVLIPIDRASGALQTNSLFDLTFAGCVPSGKDNQVVSAFVTEAGDFYVTYEPRQTFNPNDKLPREGVMSQIRIKQNGGVFSYTVIAQQTLSYNGLINSYLQNGTVAYLATTGASIIRVNLTESMFGTYGGAKTLRIDYKNGAGNWMNIDSISLSQDNKTLVATASWWGDFVKVDVSNFDGKKPEPFNPADNISSNAGWVVFGVLSGVFILVSVGIFGFVVHRQESKRALYSANI